MLKLILDVDGKAFDLVVSNQSGHAWSAVARKCGSEMVMAAATGTTMASAVANLKVYIRRGEAPATQLHA